VKRRYLKRAAFVAAVAGISVLANFGVELAAEKFPNAGLARFTAYTHKGVS
jgi:hypothetical protein